MRSPHDAALHDIAEFAAALCGTAAAIVATVEGDEVRVLAHAGGAIDPALVRHAAAAAAPGILPAVAGFAAGAPLPDADGASRGAIVVSDPASRTALDPVQCRGLAVLAADVAARLGAARAAERTRAALETSDLRFRTLADTMPQMVWGTRPDGYHDYYNARWYEFTGMPPGSTDGAEWSGMFHPDDQARAWERWRHSLETGAPYQIEYRLRHRDGGYRWVLGRALPVRAADGAIVRWFGTCTDIHEQKLALEEREIISQELSHRIKNIFAVISGLVQFAARGRPEFRPAADDLRARITALGRAHDFVRPHSPHSRPQARQDSLHGLLDDLFRPYQAYAGERIGVEGRDLPIDDRAATPLALLFHELATNASKYGALSVPDGRVVLTIAVEEADAMLRWREIGGPVVAPPEKTGFGSQLIAMSVERQLGGTVTRAWPAAGLELTVAVPLSAFSRAGG